MGRHEDHRDSAPVSIGTEDLARAAGAAASARRGNGGSDGRTHGGCVQGLGGPRGDRRADLTSGPAGGAVLHADRRAAPRDAGAGHSDRLTLNIARDALWDRDCGHQRGETCGVTERSGRESPTLEQLQVLARTRGYEFSTERLTAILPELRRLNDLAQRLRMLPLDDQSPTMKFTPQ